MNVFSDTKDPDEKVVLTFDFTPGLSGDETLTGSISRSIVCMLGTDSNPSAMANGSAAFDSTSKMVLVPVQAGFDDVNYAFHVVAATTNPLKVLALSAILQVRA